MSTNEKIVAFKVSGEEYEMLQGLAHMLYEAKKLPKDTVNTLAKNFCFVVTNQFIMMQNKAGGVSA